MNNVGVSFLNARVLLKSQKDETVLADSIIVDHDVETGTIWVKAENFYIAENTKIEALIINNDMIYDCLCMTRKKDQDSTRQIFTIYKYIAYEERKENRFRMAAQGSMMVIAGSDNLKNRRIGVTITDISSGGIGFIMNEQLPIENGTLCEVYFSTNGWSMKAKCVIKNIFGPKLGCRLVTYERQQLRQETMVLDPDKRNQISKALEEMLVCVLYVDCQKDSFYDLVSMDYVKYVIGNESSARKAVSRLISHITDPEEKERLIAFYNLDDLKSRMKGKRILSTFFMGRHLGVCQISFIPVDRDENGNANSVIHIIQKLDEEAFNQGLSDDPSMMDGNESTSKAVVDAAFEAAHHQAEEDTEK